MDASQSQVCGQDPVDIHHSQQAYRSENRAEQRSPALDAIWREDWHHRIHLHSNDRWERGYRDDEDGIYIGSMSRQAAQRCLCHLCNNSFLGHACFMEQRLNHPQQRPRGFYAESNSLHCRERWSPSRSLRIKCWLDYWATAWCKRRCLFLRRPTALSSH